MSAHGVLQEFKEQIPTFDEARHVDASEEASQVLVENHRCRCGGEVESV